MDAEHKHFLPLAGLRAFVGGSSKGIGRAIAELFAEQGAAVTVMARSADVLSNLCENLSKPLGQLHTYVEGDVENPDSIFHTVEKHVNSQGPYHIVVNNTGGPAGGNLVESSTKQLMQAFQNHVIFSHHLMQIVVHKMKEIGFGRFINIISTSVKQPIDGLGVSNTIRGAMASWSKTLAAELGPHGITVNNVLPGATDTERLSAIVARKSAETGKSPEDIRNEMVSEIPVGRIGQPREIAVAAAFLASREASYITGSNIIVDGGRTRAL